MPYFYFDSTALIKRYSRERGTRIVNKLLVKRGKVILVPSQSLVELYAVLANQTKKELLTRDDWYSVVFRFEQEMLQGLYHFVTPTHETYLSVKELSLHHPQLRAAQLLHLALAIELKPLRLTMVSTDAALLECCRPYGIKQINPEDDQ
jgi:hypothetical protein